MQNLGDVANSQNSATQYTLYEEVEETHTETTLPEVKFKNYKIQKPPEPSDLDATPKLEHHKCIDALRTKDGNENGNPDTTLDDKKNNADMTDFYRLYLDVKAPQSILENVNVLFVLDYSRSMHPEKYWDDPKVTYIKDTVTEKWFEKDYLMSDEKGTIVDDEGNKYKTRFESMKDAFTSDNGIIKQITVNSGNLISIVKFANKSDVEVLTDSGNNGWTNNADAVIEKINNSVIPTSATNYVAGLQKAQEQLDKIPSNRKNLPTYMIFISDGVPTRYMELNTEKGNGQETVENLPIVIKNTNDFITSFRQENSNLNIISVAFSNMTMTDQIKAYHDGYSGGNKELVTDSNGKPLHYNDALKAMITNANNYFDARNAGDLVDAIEESLYKTYPVSNISIEDKLSAYVDLYGEQPDYKLTMTDKNSQSTTLYENGAITEAGQAIVQGISYNETSKSVKAIFKKGYQLNPDYTYTLSFNVKTTSYAYETYTKNIDDNNDGYEGTRGDENTDYGNNETSSEKPGFHSNDAATVTYKMNDNYYKDDYEHPVIQVVPCAFTIKKVNKNAETEVLKDAEFDLYRLAKSDETETGGYYLSEGKLGIKINKNPLTTDSKGIVKVQNLVPQTYYLVETKAPDGFNRLKEPFEITLTRTSVQGTGNDGKIEGSTVSGELILTIKNSPGHKLPETGSFGTSSYELGGLGIMIMSLLSVYIWRSRKGGKGR
ncbi:hypothetical protein P261_00187 [Lachnospiraceae bacterium TWA4]|nr:hypothetical protein P261_00187 [Lachnospiraceae bacterium TWA4]